LHAGADLKSCENYPLAREKTLKSYVFMRTKQHLKITLDASKLIRFCKLLLFVRKTSETGFSIDNLVPEFFKVKTIYSPTRGASKLLILLEPSKRFLDLGWAILAREFGFDVINNVNHDLSSYKKYFRITKTP